MSARRNTKKKKKNSGGLFGFFSGKKRRKKRLKKDVSGMKIFKSSMKAAAVAAVAAGVCIGFLYLEKYVKQSVPAAMKTVPVEFTAKPVWFNEAIKKKIDKALGQDEFAVNSSTAQVVWEKLSGTAWFENLQVRTLSDRIEVNAEFRRPVLKIQLGRNWYYLDKNKTALDFIPMSSLHIITVTGFDGKMTVSLGKKVSAEDIGAAVAIAELLEKMDAISSKDKPLLNELSRIDVANFGARKSSRKPHIILYTTDNTPIWWGAAMGQSAQYLEASDREKIANLYTIYKQHGTLQGVLKNIDLRVPIKGLSRPEDNL